MNEWSYMYCTTKIRRRLYRVFNINVKEEFFLEMQTQCNKKSPPKRALS